MRRNSLNFHLNLRSDPSLPSRIFMAAPNWPTACIPWPAASTSRFVVPRRGRGPDSRPTSRSRHLCPLAQVVPEPIGVRCGSVAHRSPPGVADALAPGTAPWSPRHRSIARQSRCVPRPHAVRSGTARRSRCGGATSRAGLASPRSTDRTVRDVKSPKTCPSNPPRNWGRHQTRTNWTNEWTCDQWNDRSVSPRTLRT